MPRWLVSHKVSNVELAECPDDGGTWVIYCEHEEGIALLQDTNKQRLNAWRQDTLTWCCYCQEAQ